MARLKKKKERKGKLGSGKPYDGCIEVEVTLVIPVVSWGWQLDEGEEEKKNVLFIGTQFSILYTFMYSPA